jgi:hypothetical protein
MRDEFGANHGHVARGVDAQTHLASLKAHDRHANVVADKKLLHELPGQHEHVSHP